MEKCKNCIHKFVCSILESKGYQQECEWFVGYRQRVFLHV